MRGVGFVRVCECRAEQGVDDRILRRRGRVKVVDEGLVWGRRGQRRAERRDVGRAITKQRWVEVEDASQAGAVEGRRIGVERRQDLVHDDGRAQAGAAATARAAAARRERQRRGAAARKRLEQQRAACLGLGRHNAQGPMTRQIWGLFTVWKSPAPALAVAWPILAERRGETGVPTLFQWMQRVLS